MKTLFLVLLPFVSWAQTDTLHLKTASVIATPSQFATYMKAVYSKPDTAKCVYQAINQYGEVLWSQGYRVYPPWNVHLANPGGTEVFLSKDKKVVTTAVLDYRLFNWKRKPNH